MSRAKNISYKELQKEAKRCGIPANMKRSFLESAIEAFIDNDREKLNSIVRYHKNQRKRRANMKDANFTYKAGKSKTPKIAGVASPAQASSLNSSVENVYKLSDDEDSNNFHPDSTSTPNRRSSIVNLNHYPNECARTSQYQSANDFPAPKIRSLKEVESNGKVGPMHLINDEANCGNSIPCTKPSPTKTESAQHNLNVYDENVATVNPNLAHQYQYQRQHHLHHSFRTACTNARYLNTRAADTVIPVSTTYERASVVVDVENPSYMSRVVEKQYSSYSSYCSRNVPPYANDIGTRKNAVLPEVSSRSSSDTFVDNIRPFSAVDYSSNIVQSQLSDCYSGNIADAASVNAEFDSDSDTETLSLTDDIFSLFDARVVPVENIETRSTASNAVALVPYFSETNFSNEMTTLEAAPLTWNSYENYGRRSTGNDTTNLWSSQPLTAPPSNIVIDGYNSLPSISTLLPGYKTQAYCQGYLSKPCQQSSCEFVQPCNAYSATNATSGPGRSTYETATQQRVAAAWTSTLPVVPDTETESDWNDRCDSNNSYEEPFFRQPFAAVKNNQQSNGGVPVPYLSVPHHYSNEPRPQSHLPVAAGSSSLLEELLPLPALPSYNSPFDGFAEAAEEKRKYGGGFVANAAVATANSSSRLVSKTCKSATVCETLLEKQTTSLVLKHETISIQGLVDDGNTTATSQDLSCKSLEMKIGEGVGNYAEVTSPAIYQNTSRTNLAATATAVVAAPCCARSSTSNATATTTNQFDDNESAVSSYRPRRCRNQTYGCNVITSDEESARMHERECLHQVVNCPSDECNWCGIVRTLTDHVYMCHKPDLNVGNDLVYVIDRNEKDSPFVTYFQLHEGTIFVITLHVNENQCIATMQYLPEIETADYKNRSVRGTMQLVYFTGKVETKCWKGIVRPYFENDKTLYETGNVLQTGIADSRNVVIRILIE